MSCARGCCDTSAQHYRSLALGADSPQRAAAKKDEADMHAYKRLRQSGLQPAGIAGSSQLEREANTSIEVERGMLIRNSKLRDQVAEAHHVVRTVHE